MMQVNEVRALLGAALADLDRAVEELLKPTVPATPMPRPRRFEIAPGIVWPSRSSWGDVVFTDRSGAPQVYPLSSSWGRGLLLDKIVAATGAQPRRLLRALRRIEAATAWCRDRRAGRERMAQEILRQQMWAIEALEAEIAWRSLR